MSRLSEQPVGPLLLRAITARSSAALVQAPGPGGQKDVSRQVKRQGLSRVWPSWKKEVVAVTSKSQGRYARPLLLLLL